jgi:hypothetical protein
VLIRKIEIKQNKVGFMGQNELIRCCRSVSFPHNFEAGNSGDISRVDIRDTKIIFNY